MTVASSSMVKRVWAGAIGGLVASILTGGLGVAASQGTNEEVFFIAIARDWGFGDSSLAGGWALHLLTGLVVGAVILGVTSRIPMLSLTTWPRAIGIGLGAGILVWIVLLYPLAVLFIPESFTANEVMGTLIGHVIFGVVTAIIAVIVLRRSRTVKPGA